MTKHGYSYAREYVPRGAPHYDRGQYGRMFSSLPRFAPDNPSVRKELMELGAPGGVMDSEDCRRSDEGKLAAAENINDVNPTICAGLTFLGQFLVHDITFDPASSFERQVDPRAIINYRTPAFELDSVYGAGPYASPHLYDQMPQGMTGRLLIDDLARNDLPRNSQNVALIGDPRNDSNLIISQLHLAFLKFHNAVADDLAKKKIIAGRDEFIAEVQRVVRWHYQWIILHEFLPHIVGKDVVVKILREGRKFYKWRSRPFIPVEFSVAACRFGHSQVRPIYRANFTRGEDDKPFEAPIFDNRLPDSDDPDDLRGGKRAPRRFVDWKGFFDFGEEKLQWSKKINTKLSSALFDLPPGPGSAGDMNRNRLSLAQRTLLRNLAFALPSGQDVAQAMNFKPLKREYLYDLERFGFAHRTPLWYYVLCEADIQKKGKLLGDVGGTIVAEVFIGLLEEDPMSYIVEDRNFIPFYGRNNDFKTTDLLKFAGVA